MRVDRARGRLRRLSPVRSGRSARPFRPGASVTARCSAAQGSSAGPLRPDSGGAQPGGCSKHRRRARGTRPGLRLRLASRPRSRQRRRGPERRCSQGLRARMAPVSASTSVDDMVGGRAARRAQHPFGIARDRQAARPRPGIAQAQARDLDRVVQRHELHHSAAMPCAACSKRLNSQSRAAQCRCPARGSAARSGSRALPVSRSCR